MDGVHADAGELDRLPADSQALLRLLDARYPKVVLTDESQFDDDKYRKDMIRRMHHREVVDFLLGLPR